MAINLAEKYSSKVAERFSLGSITDAYAGKDYEFSGVKTVKIYSVDTVPLVDYTRSGTSRFGTLTELGDTIQELTMTQDKAFNFSVDAGNDAEQLNIKSANKCLKREIDEVITPHVDKYRLNAWATGAGHTETVATPTKSNILEFVMNGGAYMSNNLVPRKNRVLFIRESTYIHVKLADQITGNDTLGKTAVKDGSVGMLDGMKVVPVPDSYFPEGVQFMIKYVNCTVDPFKLKNYRIHKNPMGVDGDVAEGRILFDSFVLETKQNGIYVASIA